MYCWFFLCAYLLKRDNRKEGVDLSATLVNLAEEKRSPLHLTSPPKISSDTSTDKKSLYCFSKQASLDEKVDRKILQILDDLLNLFDGSGKTFQGIKEQVNESFQNSHITSESSLTG